AAGDAKRLCFGIVTVLASFNIEKGESSIAIAHGKIGPLAGRKFFDYELVERRAQGCRQITVVVCPGITDAGYSVDPGRNQGHRTRLEASQQIVKHQSRKERIAAHGELQRDRSRR